MTIPSRDVWLPNLVERNNANEFYNEQFFKYFYIELFNNGSVFFSPAGKMTTSCPLNMFHFPFDVQNCEIQVSSWTSSCDEVTISSHFSTVSLR